jgi:phosphatidylserine decarboxylase
MSRMPVHQYIDRGTGAVHTEKLISDKLVNHIYATARERLPQVYRLLLSARMSTLLAAVNYDWSVGGPGRVQRLAADLGIDLNECLAPADTLATARHLFERQIRYWECRPMDDDPRSVVSPADARMVTGAFDRGRLVYLKGKFFDFDELVGVDRHQWRNHLAGGDFAVFRLTPEKYHYNHTPVAGTVRDIYEIPGRYHSCNPGAVVQAVTPFSKNKRVVTIIDTDVDGGTGVGLVAMIEIVALMIGDIRQCYSRQRYDDPIPVTPGLKVEKGCPKSVYRPGSSVDVLLFEKGRVAFADDILANQRHCEARSRLSMGFGKALVETDVRVRATVAGPVG